MFIFHDHHPDSNKERQAFTSWDLVSPVHSQTCPIKQSYVYSRSQCLISVLALRWFLQQLYLWYLYVQLPSNVEVSSSRAAPILLVQGGVISHGMQGFTEARLAVLSLIRQFLKVPLLVCSQIPEALILLDGSYFGERTPAMDSRSISYACQSQASDRLILLLPLALHARLCLASYSHAVL